jgi:hypothetical protein
MSTGDSDCFEHFGYADFRSSSADRSASRTPICPVKDCSTKLSSAPFGKREKPYCLIHGLRLHSNTFVYWNGDEYRDDARLRNFRILPELARNVALNSPEKAETHRLGYEMSEDALTWNVFVGLAKAKKLSHALKVLTGRQVAAEPILCLWGKPINVENPETHAEVFPELSKIRNSLEHDIGKFKTEPDAMLVVPGSGAIVVCIEAKFGSGNTLAHDHEAEAKKGEKPVGRNGLLARYLENKETPIETKRIIDGKQILSASKFHSQLFRNVVFASAMANGGEWHVVNLVSETQRKHGKESQHCSFDNPEEAVRSYLHQDKKKCFTYRTWEGLYKESIRDDANLAELNDYFRKKSAHYLPAFELT